MSIMRMRRRFAVHLRYVLYFIIGVFLLTLPAIFAPSGGRTSDRADNEPAIMKDPIAQVDGATLVRRDLERVYQRVAGEMAMMTQITGQGIGAGRLSRYRLEAFDEAVGQLLVMREAQRQGITVSNRQIAKRAAEIAKQQLDQTKMQVAGKDLERQLAQIATSNDGRPRDAMSERSFLNWLTKLLTDSRADDLKVELATQALEKKVTGSITATDKELLASYDEATLREIVVARHPTDKPARTDEEARKRAEGLLEQAKKGADFAQLARTQSDDEEVRRSDGRQEPMPVVHMSPAYQKALAGLKAGDLVPQPIKTDRGYIVVKVEKREQNLPPDFQKNKQRYLKDFVDQKRRMAWEAYTKQLRDKATVKVVDPEILAYQEIAKGDLAKALPLLKQATPAADQIGGLAGAAVYYEMAKAYSVQNKWKEAADAYAAANDALSGQGGIPQARADALMGMGLCYENLGDKQEAAKWYQAASDASDASYVHDELLAIYQRMGNAELVKREQQWLDDYRQREAEREKAMQDQQRKMEEEAAKKRPRPAPATTPGNPPAPPPSK